MQLALYTGAITACLLCSHTGLADQRPPPQRTAGDAQEHFSRNGEYDQFLGEGWFSYAATRFHGEHMSDSARRRVRAIGSGYRIVDTKQLQLSLRAGIGLVDEEALDGNRYADAGMHWGFDLEKTLPGQPVNFFYHHRGVQGFDTGYRTTINMSTGFRLPLASGWSATAGYDREWDLSGEDDLTDIQPSYTFGLGYDW